MVEASEQRAYIFPALEGVRFSVQATGFVHALPTSFVLAVARHMISGMSFALSDV
jgi:hypothetical protein